MRFYISDLHFGHARLNTDMDRRGFSSGEEMDQYMIRQWNSRVRHGDEVVILGDLCMFKKAKAAESGKITLRNRKPGAGKRQQTVPSASGIFLFGSST